MSSSDRPPGEPRGQLSETPPTELLRMLEAKSSTARVLFETEIGRGEVDIVGGKIVDALLGDLFGKRALLSLLGATEGRFSVSDLVAEAERPPICASLDQLLSDRARRISEWRELSEQMPPLSSSLRLSVDGEAALGKNELTPSERPLVPLLDGSRSIADVVDKSGLDAVDAFRVLLRWRRAGHVIELAGPEPKPEPFAPTRSAPRTYPIAGEGDASDTAPANAARKAAPSRRQTVIGMGIPAPEPVRPRRADVHRMISVGTPSTPPAADRPRSQTPAGIHSVTLPVAHQSVPPPHAGALVSDQTGQPVRATGMRTVGRYEVLCRIGHGGMGTVYLCRLTSAAGFRRLLALKLLRQHLLDDPAAAQRFLDEAALAGRLHHPNVVGVLDAGVDGSQPYLAMDYIEGGSLKQLVAAHPVARPAELVIPIVLDALAGLHAVHNLVGDEGSPLNVVHCDISPENLLVGVDGTCRLTDFGVARRESLVGERIAHGKPGYLAPEQVMRRPIDRRVDLFAMGIILYNSLTGTKLFDGGTVDETLRRVATDPIPPPSTVGLAPPPCFDFIVMKALERDPNRRYSTAEEMASELRRIALRENLLAPTSAVAGWVRACMGRELDQRRLAVLDAGRRASVPPGDPGYTGTRTDPPPPVHQSFHVPDDVAGDADGDGTKTEEIDFGVQARRWAVVAAAALAAGAVLVTLLWPGRVSRLFKINTAGVQSDGVEVKYEPHPQTSASSTTSAPTAPAPPPNSP